jgi:4-amino-4-deoxy-L-arabinose transferase-like glycosyltransferase
MRVTPRVREFVLIVLGFAVLTVIMTAPLSYRAASVGPINTGDGQMSIWNVSWVARALVLDPLHVLDANIFHPHSGTLAYSETNLLAGVIGIPAWWISRNPYLTYNVTVCLSFFFSALATFALVRRLTGSREAAVVAAICFAFAPFVLVRYAHIQLMMTAVLPVTLLAFHWFIDRQTPGAAIALALALAAAALACGYFGFMAGLAVGLGFIYYAVARGTWRNWRYWALGAGAVVTSALMVLPVFSAYLPLLGSQAPFRTVEESRQYSATVPAYLSSTTHLHRAVLDAVVGFDSERIPERILFPGFVAGSLALAAFAVARRKVSNTAPPSSQTRFTSSEREAVGFYALLAAFAAWASFGPAGGLYTLAYRFVPAWTMMRAPARFGTLVTLSLAVLAGLGLAAFLRGRTRPAMTAVAVALVAVAELAAFPLDARQALPVPPAYPMLSRLPAGAVAEFPFFYLPTDFHRHCLYMLYTTVHWHPIVNGYSDYTPEDFKAIDISTFPSRTAFGLLRQRGARYVVFHLRFYDRRSREKLMDAIYRYRDYLRPLTQADDVWLYEIAAWP